MKQIAILTIILFVVGCSKGYNGIENDDFEVIIENVDTPWAIDFLPSGDMIFIERSGKISIYDGEKALLTKEIPVSEVSESGLLGIAVDPELTENNFIYIYYTHPDGFNRVSRFVLQDKDLKQEKILLDKIPSAQYHDGGRIKFGPDGMIYITTGDATEPSSAQDINSLAGKILRMNKDGTIPQDNPFGNYVWSFGHRNPQGLAWKGETLYEAEHGPNRNDEINIIKKGGNYGWPRECTEIGNFTNPLRCFTEFTLAPSGIAVDEDNLYVAGLRGAQLRKLVIVNSTILGEEEFISDLGRIREAVINNNYLYFTTSNKDGRGFPKSGDDKILKVRI